MLCSCTMHESASAKNRARVKRLNPLLLVRKNVVVNKLNVPLKDKKKSTKRHAVQNRMPFFLYPLTPPKKESSFFPEFIRIQFHNNTHAVSLNTDLFMVKGAFQVNQHQAVIFTGSPHQTKVGDLSPTALCAVKASLKSDMHSHQTCLDVLGGGVLPMLLQRLHNTTNHIYNTSIHLNET